MTTELPPTVQERLDALRSDKAAKEQAAVEAAQAEEARISAMNAAKAVCAAACGPISEALGATTDPDERELLIALEAETHAEHAAALEQAHFVFSGQTAEESNPAEGETAIDAAIVVDSGMAAP